MGKELDEKTKSENRCVSAFFAFISSAAILNIIESLVKLFLRYRINDKMLLNNLEKIRENDVLKFVCNKSDFDDITNVLLKYNIKSYIYLSPIFNEIEPYELVDYLKDLNNKVDTSKIRVQVQLHKVIWNPEERGV